MQSVGGAAAAPVASASGLPPTGACSASEAAKAKDEQQAAAALQQLLTLTPDDERLQKEAAKILVQKLRIIPHHAISLKRNKYRVIRKVSRELGWDFAKSDREASMLWLDQWDSTDLTNLRIAKVGHFYGIRDLATKCSLGNTMNKIRSEFPADYDFHPITFVLPHDREKLLEYAAQYASLASTYKKGVKAGEGSKEARQAAAILNTTPAILNPNGGGSSIPPNPSTNGGLLAPPKHGGCWPSPGTQAQPMPGSGDRLAFIVKPDMSSRGNGIYLALTLDGIKELARAEEDAKAAKENGLTGAQAAMLRLKQKQQQQQQAAAPSDGSSGDDGSSGADSDDEEAAAAKADKEAEEEARKLTLVQAYLPRPLLMDGRKFDLRIYVLVTSAFPTVRAYIYRQGLIRFATQPYSTPAPSNVRNRKMFLTNYAVNKAGGSPSGAGAADDDERDFGEEDDDDEAALKAADAAAAAARGSGNDDDEDDGNNSDKPDDDGSDSDSSTSSSDSDNDGGDDEDAAVVVAGSDEAADGSAGAAGPFTTPKRSASGAASSSSTGIAAAGAGAAGSGLKISVPKGPGAASSGWGKKFKLPPRPKLSETVQAREGCKWSLDALLQCMEEQGVDSEALWGRIQDVITKTVLAARPHMAQKYRSTRPHLKREAPPPPLPKRGIGALFAGGRRARSLSRGPTSSSSSSSLLGSAAGGGASNSAERAALRLQQRQQQMQASLAAQQQPVPLQMSSITFGGFGASGSSDPSSNSAGYGYGGGYSYQGAASDPYAYSFNNTNNAQQPYGSYGTAQAQQAALPYNGSPSYPAPTAGGFGFGGMGGPGHQGGGFMGSGPSNYLPTVQQIIGGSNNNTSGQYSSAAPALPGLPGLRSNSAGSRPGAAGFNPSSMAGVGGFTSSTDLVNKLMMATPQPQQQQQQASMSGRSSTGTGSNNSSLAPSPLNSAGKSSLLMGPLPSGSSSSSSSPVPFLSISGNKAGFGVGGSSAGGSGGSVPGSGAMGQLGFGSSGLGLGISGLSITNALSVSNSNFGGASGRQAGGAAGRTNSGNKPPLSVGSSNGGAGAGGGGMVGGTNGSNGAPLMAVSRMTPAAAALSGSGSNVSLNPSNAAGAPASSNPYQLYGALQQQQQQVAAQHQQLYSGSGSKSMPNTPLRQRAEAFPTPPAASTGPAPAPPAVAAPAPASSSSCLSTARRLLPPSTSSASTSGSPAQTPAQSASPASTPTVPAGFRPLRPPKDDTPSIVSGDVDDGEQGFRCFELMGLDVILDMSHCTCKERDAHQRLVSRPNKADPKTKNVCRCQPRPVLLEINQSCSLHTDSDLDKVIKGDAVRDGFALSAPDEGWLLARLKETLEMEADAMIPISALMSAAGAGPAGPSGEGDASKDKDKEEAAAPAPSLLSRYDAAQDHARLSRARFNDIDDCISFDHLPAIRRQAHESMRQAEKEAETLLKLYPKQAIAELKQQLVIAQRERDKKDRGAAGENKDKDAASNSTSAAAPPSSSPATSAPASTGNLVPASSSFSLLSSPSAGAGSPKKKKKKADDGSGNTASAGPSKPVKPPKVPLEPTNLQLVPHVPVPWHSIADAFSRQWTQELWFGATTATASSTAGPAASSSSSAGRGSGLSGPARSSISDDTASTVTDKSAGTALGAGSSNISSGSVSAPASARTSISVGTESGASSSSSSGAGASASSASSSSSSLGLRDKDKDKEAGPNQPAPSSYSINCVPPLSQRAQLVLALRRIYEGLHIGGYQQLAPPVNPSLAERYRKIAAFIPPHLRETIAYARRRQEAMAMRAALEAKQKK